MLMTDFAMMDPGPAGESLFARCCRAVAHFFGFGEPPARFHLTSAQATSYQEPPRPELRIVPADERATTSITPLRWRRHEQLRNRPTSELPDDERQARHHAVRGLYAARSGALTAAEHHFTEAANSAGIDLTAIPGFWQLTQGAMMTAVRAYEASGRLREASALNARMRHHFRPRLLSPVPDNVTEIPVRRLSLTSNS